MPIHNGYVLHRVKVHSVSQVKGTTLVSIPALASLGLIEVPPVGLPVVDGEYMLPVPGDLRMVATDPDLTGFFWVVSPDASAMWAAITELRSMV